MKGGLLYMFICLFIMGFIFTHIITIIYLADETLPVKTFKIEWMANPGDTIIINTDTIILTDTAKIIHYAKSR